MRRWRRLKALQLEHAKLDGIPELVAPVSIADDPLDVQVDISALHIPKDTCYLTLNSQGISCKQVAQYAVTPAYRAYLPSSWHDAFGTEQGHTRLSLEHRIWHRTSCQSALFCK